MPQRNQVDLHCHTSRSDGVLEPLELYAQIRAAGTTLVAITDHDTLAGVREILEAGLGLPGSADGPRIIAGVEINTTAEEDLPGAEGLSRSDRELHIIGLGVDVDDADLDAALAVQRDSRRVRLERILERLAGMGMDVRDHLPVDDGIDSAGRPHVARALVKAGHAKDVEDAFARFLFVDGPAYVPRIGMGPREAIAAISATGGIPVLAHRGDAPEHPMLIDALKQAGLEGIEVHHRSFDEEEFERMRRFADGAGLLHSGGTDFHGDKPADYAAAQAQTHVPHEVGERILARLGA
jgi:predicted metal-dependent phosphoesterase TrpH